MIRVIMRWNRGFCTALFAFALQLRKTPKNLSQKTVWWRLCDQSYPQMGSLTSKWKSVGSHTTSGREKIRVISTIRWTDWLTILLLDVSSSWLQDYRESVLHCSWGSDDVLLSGIVNALDTHCWNWDFAPSASIVVARSLNPLYFKKYILREYLMNKIKTSVLFKYLLPIFKVQT